MTRSKRIFLIVAVVFLILLAYASYDIGSRTTFPGSKPQLKERLQRSVTGDSVVVRSDSTRD